MENLVDPPSPIFLRDQPPAHSFRIPLPTDFLFSFPFRLPLKIPNGIVLILSHVQQQNCIPLDSGMQQRGQAEVQNKTYTRMRKKNDPFVRK